jgi:hypothetical protein
MPAASPPEHTGIRRLDGTWEVVTAAVDRLIGRWHPDLHIRVDGRGLRQVHVPGVWSYPSDERPITGSVDLSQLLGLGEYRS